MKSPKLLLLTALSLGGFLFIGHAAAASPFTGAVTIDAPPPTDVTYANSDALFGAMFFNSLSAINAGYVGVETVTIDGNYRGVGINYFSPHFNPAEIHLTIPSLGVDTAFTGGTREASAQALYDFLKSGNLLADLSRELVKSSPTDPIAGNPNSMMSTMVASDYDQSFTSDFSNIASAETATATMVSSDKLTQVGIGLVFGQMTQGGTDVSNMTIPLSYSIRNDLDPRRQLLLRMPISIVDVDGAKAYNVGFGASYRFPMSQKWTLVPSVNYGLTASKDLGSTAQMVSAGITSTYYWRRPGYDVGIGNMLGFVTTMPFSYGGYNYDPNISNTVLRNGVMWSMPTVISGRKLHFETSVTDTRFFGTQLYSDSFQEVRFSLGTSRSAKATSVLRGGLALRHMKGDTGFNLEFGYWF
ncbi:MAG: hypothetical protein Q8M09_16750 [Pseudomonadota bacterium]|nr:hypothetical protein [Pseudomonadota bacterium]MDP1905868.1 hypothetical protein [Pseudomonadota bacterium]MDP2351740.1 hypothetical protein [Pseudomonadota bacterium]